MGMELSYAGEDDVFICVLIWCLDSSFLVEFRSVLL